MVSVLATGSKEFYNFPFVKDRIVSFLNKHAIGEVFEVITSGGKGTDRCIVEVSRAIGIQCILALPNREENPVDYVSMRDEAMLRRCTRVLVFAERNMDNRLRQLLKSAREQHKWVGVVKIDSIKNRGSGQK